MHVETGWRFPPLRTIGKCGRAARIGRPSAFSSGFVETDLVEPGESIEDAVIREVKEETGVIVEKLEYQHSQPWLFPSSLMLGFTATAKGKEIKVDKNELEDARWFSRKEIKDNLKKGSLRMPGKVAIAYHLIKEWFDKGDAGKLDAI